jgi:hypothetical protein
MSIAGIRNSMIELSDIRFDPSVPGPEEAVYWRTIPLGFVRQYHKKGAADAQNHRKWYSELTFCGYHDTKEQAAIALVTRFVEHNPESPLIAAAWRKDWEEVERLKEEIRQKYGIVKLDENDKRILKEEVRVINDRVLQKCKQLEIDEKMQAALLADVPIGVECRSLWLKPSSYQDVHHFIQRVIVDFQIELITPKASIRTMRKHIDNVFSIGYECFRRIEQNGLPSQNMYSQWVSAVGSELLRCPPDDVMSEHAKKAFQATCKKFLQFLKEHNQAS